ncbi:MAG: hypothetical protein IPH03_17060 [Tetrasphaera sp.]|nr:hypothetical protein [Tetrasphaera sp.]
MSDVRHAWAALASALIGWSGAVPGTVSSSPGCIGMPTTPAPPAASPLVPATVALAAVLGWRMADRAWPVPLTAALATVLLLLLAAVDLEVHRLPRLLTWPAYPLLAVLLAACSVAEGGLPPTGGSSAASRGGPCSTCSILLGRRRGLGRGDVTPRACWGCSADGSRGAPSWSGCMPHSSSPD